MSMSQRVMRSEYIEWAKLHSSARFNLATSDVMKLSLRELDLRLDDLELSGPSAYGYAPLQEALAAHCHVAPECVVAAMGTSGANQLAMAALIEPGDEVLIEQPSYDVIPSLALHLGASVRRFARPAEGEFQVDIGEIERNLTPRTRLLALTNLHNPSGALISVETIRRIGEIARGVGARVLVDEVYLELLFEQTPGSAFLLGNEFIATSSLTKAYGLSGLRCGWILAEPDIATRIWRLNDLFGNIPPHPAERLSVVAFAQLPQIAARAKTLLAMNRASVEEFLNSRNDLEAVRPAFGSILVARPLRTNADRLCHLLREKYETSVVPGRFFELPDWVRIGFGCPSEELRAGLEQLGRALDEA
jgi:hypothetical protein